MVKGFGVVVSVYLFCLYGTDLHLFHPIWFVIYKMDYFW